MLTPHATPKTVIATTDLQRLHAQLETQQDALARQADLIAHLHALTAAQPTRPGAPMYAHALIEHDGARYPVGAQLPDSLPGLAALVEHGSAGVNPPVVQIASGDEASSQETTA